MLHHMLKWLQARGHQVLVSVPDPGAEEFEGIPIIKEYQRVHIKERYRWADIIISHLNRHGKVINNIRSVDKPALFLMHNTHHYASIDQIAHRSVLCFNSKYTQSVPYYKGRESVIVYPPCPVDYYKSKAGGRHCITLINHNEVKGAEIFFKLAKKFPKYKFLAVKGDYYHQIRDEEAENVQYMENSPSIQKVYQKTKILLMPSVYESFGRTAIEAAASGIPTLAAPTPGLKESLGKAGNYADTADLGAWEEALEKLMEDEAHYKERSSAAKERAAELETLIDPQMEKLMDLMQRAIDYKAKMPRIS